VKRARLNYFVDVGIALAGLVSAVSGLVFLLPGDMTTGNLSISYQVWNAVHTWSSLAAIAGVGAHLALHWKWMLAMTKGTFWPSPERVQEPVSDLAYGGSQGSPLSRRAFLALGGAAAVVTGAIVAGYKLVFDGSSAEASESGNQLAAAQEGGGVACPLGVVNDPYPGRCKHYRDSNGDGICDYSVAGSGSNLSASSDSSFGESPRQRQGLGRP
jgi:hypothetical protein